MNDNDILKVRGLSYLHILKGVNLTVQKGEIVSLLGPNGAGKTTLFRCIAGLIKKTSGEVEIKGKRLEEYPHQELYKILAFLPQFYDVGFPYTVLTVVLMGRAPYLGPFTSPGESDRKKAHFALSFLGLENLASRPFTTLSGGQKRLVLFARTIAQEAELLLLDEPTAHLDLNHQVAVLSRLRELVKKCGFSVLMNLHDPNLAFMFSERVISIKDGKILGEIKSRKTPFPIEILEELYEIPLLSANVGRYTFVFPKV